MDVKVMVLKDAERSFVRKGESRPTVVRQLEVVDWSPEEPCATPFRVALEGCAYSVGSLVRKEVSVRLSSYRASQFGVEFVGRLVEKGGAK